MQFKHAVCKYLDTLWRVSIQIIIIIIRDYFSLALRVIIT